MARYNQIDLAFSPEGDFVQTEDGDLAISAGNDCLREDMMIRSKTETNTWPIYPSLEGADLALLVGMPNIPLTAELGRMNLTRSLVYDGLIDRQHLKIYSVPFKDSVVFFSEVVTGAGEVSSRASINLNSGIEVF
jgi:hypothetical protein